MAMHFSILKFNYVWAVRSFSGSLPTTGGKLHSRWCAALGQCHADTHLSKPTQTINLTNSTVLALFTIKQICNIRCLK